MRASVFVGVERSVRTNHGFLLAMNRTALRYVGVARLPARLGAFEIEQFFAQSTDDVDAIRNGFRRDRWVAVALQLLFLRAAGRSLDRHTVAPKSLLAAIGQRLEVRAPTIASLKSLYASRTTLAAHQKWAKQRLGLKDFDPQIAAELHELLALASRQATSVDELMRKAERWLFEKSVCIPADRSLRDAVRAAFAQSECEALSCVEKCLPRPRWAGLLKTLHGKHEDTNESVLEWLCEAPARHSPSTLRVALDKVRYLRDLGVHGWELDAVIAERRKSYAQRLTGRPPSDSRKMTLETQIPEAVCFLHCRSIECTDEALHMAARRSFDLVRRAQRSAQAHRLGSFGELRACVASIQSTLDEPDLTAEVRLSRIREHLEPFRFDPASTQAGEIRQALAEDTGAVRALMSELVVLPFEGRETDAGLRQIQALKKLYGTKATTLPSHSPVQVGRVWRTLTDGADRKRALRAFEASAMLSLRTSLRRGSAWLPHSRSFQERDRRLIPPAQWEAEREGDLDLLGQPRSPDEFIARLREHLAVSLATVAPKRPNRARSASATARSAFRH